MTHNEPIIIDLLRHGPVQGAPALYGRSDPTLRSGALSLMKRQLTQHPIQYGVIISSPKQRCLSFATQLAQQKKLPLSIAPDCAEFDFGSLDGVPFEQMNPEHRHLLQLFWAHSTAVNLPEAECYWAFSERVNHWWQSLCAQAISQRQGHHLVVTHGGVITAVMAQLLAMPLAKAYQHLAIGHASLTRIQFYETAKQAKILFIGAPAP